MLGSRTRLPRWYSLAFHPDPLGLALTLHHEAWHEAFSFLEKEVSFPSLRLISGEDDWIKITFPFPKYLPDIQKLQKMLAYLFIGIEGMEKHTKLKQYQLAACELSCRDDGSLKGYLMNAYISNDLKKLLRKDVKNEAVEIALQAMRSTATHCNFPVNPRDLLASTEDGFLSLGLRDGSGSLLATDYRGREERNSQHGYAMTSNNINSPVLQLIFLSALAAVAEWGRKESSV